MNGLKILLFYKDCIDKHGDNWRAIFLEYEQLKPNADAIAELAERNFMENELKTADENFFIAKEN
jgi:kynurenine 3-monooxygenase